MKNSKKFNKLLSLFLALINATKHCFRKIVLSYGSKDHETATKQQISHKIQTTILNTRFVERLFRATVTMINFSSQAPVSEFIFRMF